MFASKGLGNGRTLGLWSMLGYGPSHFIAAGLETPSRMGSSGRQARDEVPDVEMEISHFKNRVAQGR